jgi:hypothetical protein
MTPKNSIAAISLQRVTRSTDVIVRERIVEIAAVCGKVLTKSLVEIWCNDLSDIDPELLDRALLEVRRTCSGFFPTPGDVRKKITDAEQRAFQLKAEQLWEKAVAYVDRYFHPNLGIDRRAPELAAPMQHAIRAAGGIRHIYGCPSNELPWARKRFIEAYRNVHELGEAEHLLTDNESKEILGRLTTNTRTATARQLTPAPADSEAMTVEDRKEVGRALDCLREKFGPPPAESVTPRPQRIVFPPREPRPENFSTTPEGKAFREYAEAYEHGKTRLSYTEWAAARHSSTMTQSMGERSASWTDFRGHTEIPPSRRSSALEF